MIFDIEIELILTTFSEVALLLIAGLYLSFPTLFIQHPNQLYFYSLIFQITGNILVISLDVLTIRYIIIRQSDNLKAIVCLVYASIWFSLLFYHYLLALNIEIILKISRASMQGYKKRVFIYHLLSIVMAAVLLILIFALTDFSLGYAQDPQKTLIYNILIWYIALICIATLICVGLYLKQMIKSRSTSLLNLIILTLCIDICAAIGILTPQIMYYFDLSDKSLAKHSWFLTVCSSSIGMVEFVVLILNKRSIRLIKSVLQKQRSKHNRGKRIRNMSHAVNTEDSFYGMLVEVDEIKNGDSGLLCHFFDQVTKEVRDI